MIVIGPKFWLRLFFGPEFEPYWNLIPWYTGIEFLTFFALMIGTWYRTLESTRLIFVSYAFSVIISLAVAYPLISTFGVTGAVVGLLIGQFAQVVFMLAGTTLTRIHRMTL
jgi:O-antigen/teichoic acid export membrane protein